METQGHKLTIKVWLYAFTNIVSTACNELQLSWLSACDIS